MATKMLVASAAAAIKSKMFTDPLIVIIMTDGEYNTQYTNETSKAQALALCSGMRAAGIKVFMGSSTGDLLVEDDKGVASILKNTRRRAAFSIIMCRSQR